MKSLLTIALTLLLWNNSAFADQPSEDLQPGVSFSGAILKARNQPCSLRIVDRDIESMEISYFMGAKDSLHVMPSHTTLKWNGMEHEWYGEAFGEEGALKLYPGNNGQYFLVLKVSQYPDRRFPNPAMCELFAK